MPISLNVKFFLRGYSLEKRNSWKDLLLFRSYKEKRKFFSSGGKSFPDELDGCRKTGALVQIIAKYERFYDVMDVTSTGLVDNLIYFCGKPCAKGKN